jgi:hypothetical protein
MRENLRVSAQDDCSVALLRDKEAGYAKNAACGSFGPMREL